MNKKPFKFFQKKLENKPLRITLDTGSLKEIPYFQFDENGCFPNIKY
jgi:hypothetical protein